MSSLVKFFIDQQLIKPPSWMKDNLHYEAISGSESYGSSCNDSDKDLVGFCIPKKEIIFPHTAGFIPHFGTKDVPERFDQFQQHHIKYQKNNQDYEADVTVYNIVRYFQLCMENNPNM